MTKDELMDIARRQLALDCNCAPEDFLRARVSVTENVQREGRRMFEDGRHALRAVCFGGSAVFSVMPEMMGWCTEKFAGSSPDWLFELPKLWEIQRELGKHGKSLSDIHLFFLPEPGRMLKKEENCLEHGEFELRWFEHDELEQFRGDEHTKEALAFDEHAPDMLALAAYINGMLIGMAGASYDSPLMWQIGVGVTEAARGRGIAAGLTSLLRDEVERRGKVPFYGTAPSHMISQNVARRAGFFPAWTEIFSD